MQRGFAPGFAIFKKGSTRFTDANDKVYQLLAHSRWFFQGTPASSTTKTGRHDITDILLKMALNIINQIYMVDRCAIDMSDSRKMKISTLLVDYHGHIL